MAETKITFQSRCVQARRHRPRPGWREARRTPARLHRHARLRQQFEFVQRARALQDVRGSRLRHAADRHAGLRRERGAAGQSDLPRTGAGGERRAHLPGQESERGAQPHRHDRLELRRRHRGLCLRRRQARRRGDLVGRLGRRRAQVPRPASGRGGLEEVHRHAGRGQAPSREDRQVADGAALRHRADPGASARAPGAELHSRVHRRDGAEHVRLPRRRRDRQRRRPPDPAAALLGQFGDADRTVDRDVQARQPAVRSAPVRRDRPFHVLGEQHARAQRDLRLAGKILPGRRRARPRRSAMAESRRYSDRGDGRVHARRAAGHAAFPPPTRNLPPNR